MEWLSIVSGVLGVIAVIFGVKWGQVKKLIKELMEVVGAISTALEDDDISKEEVKNIAKESGDVIAAAAKLFKGK